LSVKWGVGEMIVGEMNASLYKCDTLIINPLKVSFNTSGISN